MIRMRGIVFSVPSLNAENGLTWFQGYGSMIRLQVTIERGRSMGTKLELTHDGNKKLST